MKKEFLTAVVATLSLVTFASWQHEPPTCTTNTLENTVVTVPVALDTRLLVDGAEVNDTDAPYLIGYDAAWGGAETCQVTVNGAPLALDGTSGVVEWTPDTTDGVTKWTLAFTAGDTTWTRVVGDLSEPEDPEDPPAAGTTVTVDAGGGRTVVIPKSWFTAHGLAPETDDDAGWAALAQATGANGLPVWRSYDLGLAPEAALGTVTVTAGGAVVAEIPQSWFIEHGLVPAGAAGAEPDWAALAQTTGANGLPVWQSFVAGLEPGDPDSKLTARLVMVPSVSWTEVPALRYTVWWSEDLNAPQEAWHKVENATSPFVPPLAAGRTRCFFRVTAEVRGE